MPTRFTPRDRPPPADPSDRIKRTKWVSKVFDGPKKQPPRSQPAPSAAPPSVEVCEIQLQVRLGACIEPIYPATKVCCRPNAAHLSRILPRVAIEAFKSPKRRLPKWMHRIPPLLDHLRSPVVIAVQGIGTDRVCSCCFDYLIELEHGRRLSKD